MQNKMLKDSTKLNWKKIWLSDKSGYWYAAKVPILNWEYIVEDIRGWDKEPKFLAGVFLSKTDDSMIRVYKKDFETEQEAMNACEKHIQDTWNKFSKWINTK